jgi:methionyl-tRNA formyltransferase
LEELNPDTCVVVAFGQILPREFFDFPPLGTLNVHASILPAYRGAAPIVHTLLNGEKETGVTIMKIDAGMDTGDILSIEKVPVSLETTAGELEDSLALLGSELLVKTLVDYASNKLAPVSQNPDLATYASMISKEMAQIDWENDSMQIHNLIRAMNPRPGAFTSFRNVEVKVWRSHPIQGDEKSNRSGSVVDICNESIIVECGGNSLLALTELQMPNRKRVSAVEFINGNRLEVLERFG